jgi:hypothetical protein
MIEALRYAPPVSRRPPVELVVRQAAERGSDIIGNPFQVSGQ